ncbi:MAG: single-stranded-DNA-specific exonuclease RecJ [Desulfobacterota bacterium]|nr:single-stranded-DNA-specific exonuclease RecJ [Thermodesulfobacteriota bacterium]MDW8001371.1 single-stranded-DNA-specific exonuclease RecJ [Deltaproteobacteria bacterium]
MVEDLKSYFGLPSVVARVLLARGIRTKEEAEKFLFPDLKDLSDPYLLPDMDLAVKRVVEAITKNEKIAIYGDYDADGITSCALLVNFFKKLGIDFECYIPTRMEGYGLNEKAVRKLFARGNRLLITLDCGSTNAEEVELAKSLGMDTVIIDHHEVKDEGPPSYAFVNPKREDSSFPTRDLAACGVTFFFLIALRRELLKMGKLHFPINLKNELDFVTLGTVGDVVPLTGQNRLIVKFGFEMMKKKPRQWLKSFYETKTIPRNRLDDYILTFFIIPRINAPGRVSRPKKSLDFLIEEDPEISIRLLEELNEDNRMRQSMEEKILNEINAFTAKVDLYEKKCLVFFKEDWHIGVLGIVAQRLCEAHAKPAIILTSVDGVIKGSGRAPEKINLFESLKSISHLLLKYGGHKYACGLSLTRESLEEFSLAFESILESISYEKKEIPFDTEANFDELSREAVEALELLGPFGYGNPPPRILLFPEAIYESGGKVKILDKKKRIWYGYMAKPFDSLKEKVRGIIVTPFLKEEMGEVFVNLLIRDFIE